MNTRVSKSLMVGSVPDSQRLQEEIRIVNQHFVGFTMRSSADPGVRALVTGELETFKHTRYGIMVVAPREYPHALPVVLPMGWVPRRNPHMLSSNGEPVALCLMKASQWNAAMSLAFVIAKAALWLNKYEVWCDRGIWPGREQHEHGLVYDIRKWWHEL